LLNYLVSLCATEPGQIRLTVFSDLFIALAYFSIPFSMLWVFRSRKEDLPYPGLWISFVLFIFACGMTHFLHVASYLSGTPLTGYTAVVHFATAIVSMATAVSLTLVLPKVNLLPSPQRQRRELEQAVQVASREKDAMLVELNHRVGNQLAKLSALTRKEIRDTGDGRDAASLDRIRLLLEEMSAEHHRLQREGYSSHHPAHHFLGQPHAGN
jgi:hypothetical protein